MQTEHVIMCGGLVPGRDVDPEARVLPLNLWSGKPEDNNVVLRIEDLHERLWTPVPPAFEDLLEVAAYVYCADQATSRGQMDVDTFGAKWRRRFRFHIPVRMPDLWNGEEVKRTLCETLGFLSDDAFEFTFCGTTIAPGMQQYLDLAGASSPVVTPEQVIMFSGGLDSLAGAIEESVVQKRRVMLVNHRPTPKVNRVHRELQRLLAEKAGEFRPLHLHVRIHKSADLNKEYTQRTRSFLYVALGSTVSMMLGQRCVRFYENGVVSLNLPVCAQVVGGRATRTTHPRVLGGFGRLLTLLAGAPFTVENPFIWETKGDVVGRIVKAGCAELIDPSVSCAHTWEMTREHTHCGSCSQCIDRRFGVLAAKAEAYDSAGHYATDVFTGTRSRDEDKTMVAAYLERANQVRNLRNVAQFIAKYPEVARVLRHLPGEPAAVAERVLTLHRRHAEEVNGVVDEMLAKHRTAIRERSLPRDCLLRTVYEPGFFGGNVQEKEPVKKPTPAKPSERKEQEYDGNGKYPATLFRLRKSRGFWILIYQGRDEILADERGVVLAEYLLKNPPEEPIHAVELEAHVDGNAPPAEMLETVSNTCGAGSVDVDRAAVVQEASGSRLNAKTGVLLKRKLSELKAEIEDVTLPQAERDAAQEEYDDLVRSADRGGKMADSASRAAERVRKALKRLIDGLKQSDLRPGKPNRVLRDFGDHLEKQLWIPSVGVAGGRRRRGAVGAPGRFTYVALPGVVWKD